MFTLVLVCFLAITVFIAFMAVGVMAGREPLKGTCGGLNKLGLQDGECPVCGGNPAKCESREGAASKTAKPALARDLMKK